MASNLRSEEYIWAEKEGEYAERATTQTAQEIGPICHYAPTAHRERGYRAVGLFCLPSIWEYLAGEVTAIEIQHGEDSYFHHHTTCHTANVAMILRYPEMDI